MQLYGHLAGHRRLCGLYLSLQALRLLRGAGRRIWWQRAGRPV